MAAVRSKRLIEPRTVLPGTSQLLYTCGPGETALVKRLTVVNTGGVAGDVIFSIDPAGVTPVHSVLERSVAASSSLDHETWWVLQPGDALRVDNASAVSSFNVCVFGAELEGVAD